LSLSNPHLANEENVYSNRGTSLSQEGKKGGERRGKKNEKVEKVVAVINV
jgi:hypothetical protein